MEDYHKEIKIVLINANIIEDKKVIMAMFFNRFNRNIANIIELQHYLKLNDIIHMDKN